MWKRKVDTLTTLILIVAFGVCGAAWMRFFYVALSNPSPARYVQFIGVDGPRDAFRQSCSGPAFIEGDSVWRFCQYDVKTLDTQAGGRWGLARFDLAEGKARLLWPLLEDQTSQILALAKSPSGELAAAWGAPDLSMVYRILPEGGVVPLGLPPVEDRRIMGMAWVGSSLELVAGDTAPVTITTHDTSAWSALREIPAPDGCTDDLPCTLQVAYRQDDGWHFLYARPPDDPARAEIDLIQAAESGEVTSTGSVPLSEFSEDEIHVDDAGEITSIGDLFDRSPGNVVNWTVDAPPLLLYERAWTRVEVPADNASFFFSDYRLTPDGLRWIPGVRFPRRAWLIGDQWLTLARTEHGTALTELNTDRGLTLTLNTSFVQQASSLTEILPASDGGYWVLGPYGAYLKADAALERADPLNIVERVRRLFENFSSLNVYHGEFYRQQTLLKMVAFPLVLFSLPVGYLLVFFARQAQRDTRLWLRILLRVSAVYLILTTIFMWWFWEIMGVF